MTAGGGASPSASAAGGGLRLRVLAAAVLVPAVLLVTWAGVLPFMLLVAALAMLMAREWTDIVHGGDAAQFVAHALAGALAALAAMPGAPAGWLALLVASLWVASIFLRAWTMAGFSLFHVLGVAYVALPAFALVALRAQPACGLAAVLVLFAVVWSADTAAYFAGRALGGPKLAPRISPKKTWAGFLGAVAGGAIAGLLGALIGGFPAAGLTIAGAVLGAIEQLGDLFESAAKRRYGVKDSGTLIPGHGGVLDRVDGLVAAAVLALAWGMWASGSLADAACGLLLW